MTNYLSEIEVLPVGWSKVFSVFLENFIVRSASWSNGDSQRFEAPYICIKSDFPPSLQIRQSLAIFSFSFSLSLSLSPSPSRSFIPSASATRSPTFRAAILLHRGFIMYLFKCLAGLSAVLVGVAALPQPMPAPTPAALYDIIERAPEPTLEPRQGQGCRFETCVMHGIVQTVSS